MHERISVIIPVYNGECFLAEAIQSVLDQTLPPDEVIVVDDGSTDGSVATAHRFPEVRCLHQPHRGVGAALNLALRHAHGELLAFLDADDRWLSDKLERQARAMRAMPALDMAFGHVRQFQDTQHGSLAHNIAIDGEVQVGISRCALLVRRSALDRVGEFSELIDISGFLDWYIRAQDAGLNCVVLPEVVFERRIHSSNQGRRMPDAQRQSYLQTLRLSLARRRADTPDTL